MLFASNSKSVLCVNATCCSKFQQFKLTFIWLGMKFGSKFIVDVASGKSLYSVYISAPVLCPYSIAQWLIERHRGPIRLCWKNSSQSSQASVSLQLRPSLPFIDSFGPWSVSPLSSVPRSLSIYLWKGHLADGLSSLSFSLPLSACLLHISAPPPPPSCLHPTRASPVVCLSSVEVSFLSELRWKDCFSCVYTKTVRTRTKWLWACYITCCLVQRVPTWWLHFWSHLFEFHLWFVILVMHWCVDWN